MNRDALDAAIDHVSARLVAVPADDAELSQRIIGALPDRPSRLHRLIPQFAALGAIAIAAVMWTSRDLRPAPPPLPSSIVAARAPLAPSATRMPVDLEPEPEPEPVPGTEPLEPLAPLEPLEPLAPLAPLEPLVPSPDFERALPAIPALDSLELAPIEIHQIAMTADVPPHR